jgi:cell division protein FtsB
MKLLVLVLVILLLLLQYKLWFGGSGFQKLVQYQNRIEVLREELRQLRGENSALQVEVDDLKNGLGAIEERARRDLGMIKENETFFLIIEPTEE